jgi:hypothetical protein
MHNLNGYNNIPGAPGNLSGVFDELFQRANANTKPRTNLNAASVNNAGFYAGPQLGQSVPPGFQNKIVS